MSTARDGGTAFPQPMHLNPGGQPDWPSNGWGLGGMSLRDYFAGQAIPGILAGRFLDALAINFDKDKAGEAIAKLAYEVADHMLAARAEVQKP